MGNSTHGKKLLPVPPGLEAGLRGLGFRPVEPIIEGTHRWTHPKLRTMTIRFTPSTIPGDDAVVMQFEHNTGAPRRLEPDQLLTLLTTMMGARR